MSKLLNNNLGKFLSVFLFSIITINTPSMVFADDSTTGLEQLPTNIPNPPNLDKTDLSRKAIIVDLKKVPKVTPEVKLVSSYPNSSTVLWVPLREAHLTFDKPVRPVDVKLEILNNIEGSKQPEVVRASVDPDLKTIRFSVSGVRSGSWLMKWSAGKSSGTLPFSMTVTPKALGGQNHRHDSAGITNTDKVGKLVLSILPLTLFLIIRKRKLAGNVVATISTLITAGLALYASYLALDFTSTRDFYISLSSASPWSWVSISVLSLLLLVEAGRKKILLSLLVLLSLIIATTPHDQTLSRFLLTSLIYFALTLNIFASVYLLTLNNLTLKMKITLKVALWFVISFFAILNIYSANGFSQVYGNFLSMQQRTILFSSVGLLAFILTDSQLFTDLKGRFKKMDTNVSYVTFSSLNKAESEVGKKALTKFLDRSDVMIEVLTKNTVLYVKNKLFYHTVLLTLIIFSLLIAFTLFISLGQLIQFAPASAGL